MSVSKDFYNAARFLYRLTFNHDFNSYDNLAAKLLSFLFDFIKKPIASAGLGLFTLINLATMPLVFIQNTIAFVANNLLGTNINYLKKPFEFITNKDLSVDNKFGNCLYRGQRIVGDLSKYPTRFEYFDISKETNIGKKIGLSILNIVPFF